MGANALGILPMLQFSLFFFFFFFFLRNDLQTRAVAFEDDLTVAGKSADIKNFWGN